MRLLFLPAWFPSARSPMAGRFALDQARALQRHVPGLRLAVASWGHHEGALSLRSASESLAALRWRLAQPRAVQWTRQEGLDVLRNPALSWTLRWRGGGVAGQLAACRRMLAALQARWGGIDAIHAHVSFPAGLIARALAREAGVPYVLTEHMSPFPFPALCGRDGRPLPWLQPVFADAAQVMAVSPALAAQIRAQGLRCDRVLPNVVDEDRFPALPPPVGAPWRWLAVAALKPQKGIDLLLRAWAQWNPPAAQARLQIAGDGPERAALQALAASLGLAGRVEWLGALHPEAVPAALQQAHALVLPSRHETFGVVLAEALMAGRPVLATRCGGPEAVVGPGDGLLVPPEDVPALAAGLQQLSSTLGMQDAAALRARALDRFGSAAVAAQLQQVYRGLGLPQGEGA